MKRHFTCLFVAQIICLGAIVWIQVPVSGARLLLSFKSTHSACHPPIPSSQEFGADAFTTTGCWSIKDLVGASIKVSDPTMLFPNGNSNIPNISFAVYVTNISDGAEDMDALTEFYPIFKGSRPIAPAGDQNPVRIVSPMPGWLCGHGTGILTSTRGFQSTGLTLDRGQGSWIVFQLDCEYSSTATSNEFGLTYTKRFVADAEPHDLATLVSSFPNSRRGD